MSKEQSQTESTCHKCGKVVEETEGYLEKIKLSQKSLKEERDDLFNGIIRRGKEAEEELQKIRR